MINRSRQPIFLLPHEILSDINPGHQLQYCGRRNGDHHRRIGGGRTRWRNGRTIEIGPGTYELSAPLEPKPGMKIRGAGTGKTIITHQAGWKPSTEKLPDSEVNMKRIDTRAYLVRLKDNSADISISNLTLRAPQLHGAIFGTGIRILIFIT